MKYTEEEKKAFENLNEILTHKNDVDIVYGYNIERPYPIGREKIAQLEIIKNLLEKQQKEIERLGGLNIVRSGKNLLSKITSDYVESASKEIELQSVSGYTIDFVIDLFKRGFVLVNEKEFKKGKDIIKKTRKSRITGRGGQVNEK